MGPAICMAGLGRANHLPRTYPGRRPVLSARARHGCVPRSLVWPVGRPDRDLLVERRAAEVAMGRGKTKRLAPFSPDPNVGSPVNIPDGAGVRFLTYVCRGGPARWSLQTRLFSKPFGNSRSATSFWRCACGGGWRLFRSPRADASTSTSANLHRQAPPVPSPTSMARARKPDLRDENRCRRTRTTGRTRSRRRTTGRTRCSPSRRPETHETSLRCL